MVNNGTEQRGGPLGAEGAAPARVRDLADGCVRFVERALGVKLDYEPETLSVLDHWVEQGRKEIDTRPTTAAIVAHAAGAYFGEVVRRRFPSWWRADGDDPGAYRIELGAVYLAFSPVQLVVNAIYRAEDGDAIEIDEADRETVAARLAELPEVSEDEYFALSTRLEVIDIAVDAIRARRVAEGDAEPALGPEDYDD